MSKRVSNSSTDVTDLSRPKRPRRDAAGAEGVASDGAMSDHEGTDAEGGESGTAAENPMSPEEVRTLGSTLLQTVKDAVKDGRLQCEIFLKKPPKKTFPDYYLIIQQPIALDDIKSKLDKNKYPTLEAVRQDFELCFNNAKTYNMEGSQVWNDAKDLLKLVNKTYSKMVPSEDREEKKSKPPSLHRLLKTRLQKLVDKTEESGRLLSTEFMELPSRKLWPNYYKEIKKPQCFNNIFKRLKRKEYHTAEDFANDVELIFSNAMTFNQDHTLIWEDALALRNLFRQYMSDLPAPFSVPQYTQPPTKIKIKPPTMHASTSGSKAEHTSSLTLRVPATLSAHKPPAAIPEPTLPVARNTAKPVPAQLPVPVPVTSKPSSSPKLPVMKATATPKPIAAPRPVAPVAPLPVQHPAPALTTYPSNSYVPTPAPSIPTPVPVPTLPQQVSATHVYQHVTPAPTPVPHLAPSPTPVPSSQHQLKCAKIEIQPRGRIVYMDYRDGVKSWAIRLGPGESRIIVKDVSFLDQQLDEEEESSDEEEEEEGAEDEMDVDTTPTKNGRVKKTKPRKRGRPPTRASARQATMKSAKKEKSSKPGEVQLKVNKLLIKEQPEKPGEWDVHLPVGPSVLELGEVGGLIWKLYADRMGTV